MTSPPQILEAWRDGRGPQKQLALLDQAPWRLLASMVPSFLVEIAGGASRVWGLRSKGVKGVGFRVWDFGFRGWG